MLKEEFLQSHNPYFSRWFSAIGRLPSGTEFLEQVTILILVDGFLQYENLLNEALNGLSQSLF